jgi:hypothetical protein
VSGESIQAKDRVGSFMLKGQASARLKVKKILCEWPEIPGFVM